MNRHLLLALLLALPYPLRADPPAPGHSSHGEAFDDGPRQAAHLMGGTGDVHLPVTTTVRDAQAFFDQGVGQLHGFWYFEAERSFRQVARLEPDCAMAYWGMAMANVQNKSRAEGFIRKAHDKKASASPREQQWIAAYHDYWLGKADDKMRRRNLVRALEDLNLAFPDELEAKAFLLFHIWDNAERGWPIPSRLAVNALINDVLKSAPMHPAHHYTIHLWDEEKPTRALRSAALCGPSAPTIAHMWHMPGHTYSKLKRYANAAWQQEAATRVDHQSMLRDGVLPDQIHNYAHNSQWLVDNFTHLGRVHDAVALAKNLATLPRHPKFNTLGTGPDGRPQKHNSGSSGQARKRLFDSLTRFELWDELVTLADNGTLEPTDLPAEQVKRLRALGLALFGRGDLTRGKAIIADLEERLAQLRSERYTGADEAEAKAMAEKKSAVDVAKAMAEALQRLGERKPALDNALAELRGLEALARDDWPAAHAQFDKASDTPADRMARYQLIFGDATKAIALARQDVAAGENQVARLANLVDLLDRCGRESEARTEMTTLRTVAGDADLDLPVLRRLAPLAREMGLPTDWRLPRPPAADLGERPALDTLGPLHWQPWAAPPWRLPTAEGQEVALADYRGKPVVVIGYLGSGCVHCVVQLAAFGPMRERFAAAGIDLVAISSESQAALQKSVAGDKLGPDVPVLADPEWQFFKAYRAFDDFEGQPLHGTFLIDGRGRVRWQDVSFEPFTDAEFLLGEAKRLLGQR